MRRRSPSGGWRLFTRRPFYSLHAHGPRSRPSQADAQKPVAQRENAYPERLPDDLFKGCTMPTRLAYLIVVLVWASTPLAIKWSAEAGAPIGSVMLG